MTFWFLQGIFTLMPKKKKLQQKQASLSQSVDALTSNGLKAFRQKDYEKAIQTWEKIPANLRPVAMLAEGHSRLGLALFYGGNPAMGLAHLQTAAAYLPDDPGYAYHLGLARHRLNDLPGALAAYQMAVRAAGPFARRAAYPLALALLQNGQEPAAAPTWKTLTTDEQAMLLSASAFRRRPYTLQPDSPMLWHTLVSYDSGDRVGTLAGLAQARAGLATPVEQGVAYFYRGALAAQTEDFDTARREWEAAYQVGLRTARLQGNLAELYHRRAEDLLQQGDVQTALAAAQEAKRHRSDDKALDELLAQIHQQLGYQAATANRWQEAQLHWETAVTLDDSNFRLAYNLALAYEKAEQYQKAGEAWREALRRRPRRADHPDALSDAQVARLWQHTAECYHQAGEYEEVSRTYQQAIKWAPDNLDIRLALANSLMGYGRLQAARNELERLLERDPKHIPALLRLGEAYFRDEDSPWYDKLQAKKYWEQALELEPKNHQVRQALAEWYFDRAEIDFSWDHYQQAIPNYQKALEFRPHHIPTLVYLVECYIELEEEELAQHYIQQILAHAAEFDDYASLIGMLLRTERFDDAWQRVVQAEQRFGKIPTDFYVAMALALLKNRYKQPAQRWIDRAIEKATPEDNIYVMLGEMASHVDAALAISYLQKAIEIGQLPGQAHLWMGIIESRQGNQRTGRQHFSEAERIARRTKDNELLERVQMARAFASRMGSLFNPFLGMGDPGDMGSLLDLLNDIIEDD
jgi:tetratricopeptide (TPR) repeat protein